MLCVSSYCDAQCGRTCAHTSCASPATGSLRLSGSTATFTGASRGWNFRITRSSPFSSGSTVYASTSTTSRMRSTPAAGSITYGTTGSFVSGSK